MSGAAQPPVKSSRTLPSETFRLDIPLHDLLNRSPEPPRVARAEREPRTSLALPSPEFPRHPELLHGLDAAEIAAHELELQTGMRGGEHWACRAARVMKWLWKQVPNGFQGVNGSFE